MEKIKISLKTFIIILVFILLLIMISLINIISLTDTENNSNKIIINNENILKTELSKNMKTVTFTSGLHAGSKNKQNVILENDEIFISIELLETILGNNAKIVYNEEKNIIKAFTNIANFEDKNTFLTIFLETETIKWRPRDKVQFTEEKMEVLPIFQEKTILLPMKYILGRLGKNSYIYYDDTLALIRWNLQDFELDFLNDFPYNVVGSYVSNSVVSYYQAQDISQDGVIYKKDNKYGLATYNVEKYIDNSIPKGRYLGYDIALEAEYDEILFIPYDYNIYILKKDNKSLIYNIKDKLLSEEYDLIEEMENSKHDYKVKKNGKYGIYGVTEIIYDDIWYEQGKTTGINSQYTEQGIYGLLNGEKVLIKELTPMVVLHELKLAD